MGRHIRRDEKPATFPTDEKTFCDELLIGEQDRIARDAQLGGQGA